MLTRLIALLAIVSVAGLGSSASAQTVTKVTPSAANSFTPDPNEGTTMVGANVALPAGTPGTTVI